jgi:hypothetical protein
MLWQARLLLPKLSQRLQQPRHVWALVAESWGGCQLQVRGC